MQFSLAGLLFTVSILQAEGGDRINIPDPDLMLGRSTLCVFGTIPIHTRVPKLRCQTAETTEIIKSNGPHDLTLPIETMAYEFHSLSAVVADHSLAGR